ncbi:hypothetical protein VTK73DRAFT_3922 [Phialemonium thermophilum]|uniref:Uncharacterized protein n=1 Tax=Phialemonium thermophilum TaxID=223376 RepID=A0ABR3WVZ8_9PEZI
MDVAPDLRPGDEGFTGFDRQLPENCVEYMIFLIDTSTGQKDVRKILSRLDAVRKEAVRLSDELTNHYIWQRESFALETKSEGGLIYLHGITDYGDCVEDEWLIVYLLRRLSMLYEDLWIRVFDSDGEFLLIEAANVLPKWLSPEIDSNRVWIHAGKLRVIPLRQHEKHEGRKASLSLTEAVSSLRNDPSLPIYSPLIEAEAFYRLDKYPGQIANSLHHSKVTIPRKLAYVIHDRPKAIAPATEAFYLRDPLTLRPLMCGTESLVFPPTDLVTVSVCFTKVLFAQLKSQHFDPPPAWAPLLAAAESEAAKGSDEARKIYARLEMGMKVTCGYEILVRNAHKSNNRVVREVALVLEDLAEDGNTALPTDEKIRNWEGADREDDDTWLDINYEDFEQELDGNGRKGDARTAGREARGGFGNAQTQADLRKIVSRFEAFLNDERAGIEGAELEEDMDLDDDIDDEVESDTGDSEDEDKDVSFDEEQFANMMREMMGLPPGQDAAAETSKVKETGDTSQSKGKRQTGTTDLGTDSEDEEIRKLMKQMEAELNQHGALDLEPKPRTLDALMNKAPAIQQGTSDGDESEVGRKAREQSDSDEEDEGEDVDLDYNLAKNVLESFKSQAGMAGPAGNLLNLMGLRLPRDEGDEEDDDGADTDANRSKTTR